MNIKNCKTIIFIILTILVIFLMWQNNFIVLTNYEYKNKKIPKGFNGYKILHISDLHNKNFYGRLTKKIKDINPDVILITGDLIDRRKTRIDIAMEFISEAVEIAPIYYVSGNHEQLSDSYVELKAELKKYNVSILDNGYIALNNNEDEIGLMGIADPTIIQSEETHSKEKNTLYAEGVLKKLYKNVYTEFNILLSHRPELFRVYRAMNVDLAFSGHAHGGQIRIPFIGGVLSPNQGFFPKYSEGMIVEGDTSMLVSRGLGNSLFPFRIFNRPELVVVNLKNN